MARIVGTSGDDLITASASAPVGLATSGADTIFALAGNDLVASGEGNDRVDVGSGNDWVAGGGGNDWIAGQAGDDALFGDGDADGNIDYGAFYNGADQLFGGEGDDYLDGQGGNDRLSAGPGNDVLLDRYGTNTLIGGDGNDYLNTGAGRELAGAGADWLDATAYDQGVRITMNGGTGADTFRAFLNGTDDPAAARTTLTIEDFNRGQGDRLLIAAGVTQADVPHILQGADLFRAFDSNGSGRLGDGDAHAFAEAGGVRAEWFNIDLVLRGDATTAADWLS